MAATRSKTGKGPNAPKTLSAKAAGKRKATHTPSASEDEDPRPPKKKAAPAEVVYHAGDIPLFTLVYGRNGRIRLKCIHHRLRRVIKTAFISLKYELYVYDAFPDTLKQNKLQFLAKCLKKAAMTLDEHEIYHQFSVDFNWTKEIISLLETQLSQLQGYVRRLALIKVPLHYKLNGNPPDLQERVLELLRGLRYVYAGDVMGVFDATKPFMHPCIADIIFHLLWTQRRSFLQLATGLFDIEWNGEAYKIIPGPLVCLVATAIHSVLRDMSTPAEVP
ncbi:hypothetical protein PsYK624_171260 [Phanerochaete sordida]|uniref:DUF6532 domain-containing protein n=1 Tax=Phanerochaete sordida TaxID=48140 RepID=A0A9P3GT77_9APHY|nr:hypothetical protein PsYK624_171260 [Phanerochaete sordida]